MPSLQNKMLMKEEENLLILIFCLLYIYSKDTVLANTWDLRHCCHSLITQRTNIFIFSLSSSGELRVENNEARLYCFIQKCAQRTQDCSLSWSGQVQFFNEALATKLVKEQITFLGQTNSGKVKPLSLSSSGLTIMYFSWGPTQVSNNDIVKSLVREEKGEQWKERTSWKKQVPSYSLNYLEIKDDS